MNSSPDSLISLGVVGKRRGLAGELRFKCWNAASTTLDDVTAVGERVLWGVGLHESIVKASLRAIMSAVNRAERDAVVPA